MASVHRPGIGIATKQQVQHRHEVTLPEPKLPSRYAALLAPPLTADAMKPRALSYAFASWSVDDVVVERRLAALDPWTTRMTKSPV
jgi:hypothetical protein